MAILAEQRLDDIQNFAKRNDLLRAGAFVEHFVAKLAVAELRSSVGGSARVDPQDLLAKRPDGARRERLADHRVALALQLKARLGRALFSWQQVATYASEHCTSLAKWTWEAEPAIRGAPGAGAAG